MHAKWLKEKDSFYLAEGFQTRILEGASKGVARNIRMSAKYTQLRISSSHLCLLSGRLSFFLIFPSSYFVFFPPSFP
jgi:hypothetical protein